MKGLTLRSPHHSASPLAGPNQFSTSGNFIIRQLLFIVLKLKMNSAHRRGIILREFLLKYDFLKISVILQSITPYIQPPEEIY